MATPDLAALLETTWFAAHLTLPARQRLAALGRLAEFPAGAVVLREGEPCEALGVVVDGLVAIRLRLPGGDDRTILTIHAGDVYGWSAVLPQAIATSTVVAVQPTRAVTFERDDLRQALASDCDLAAAVYARLLASVARRLSATRFQLLDLYKPGAQSW